MSAAERAGWPNTSTDSAGDWTCSGSTSPRRWSRWRGRSIQGCASRWAPCSPSKLPVASLGGLLARYSTIHVPDEELPRALAEFHRVLAAGGFVQLGFQVGDEPLRRIAELLRDAGLEVVSRVWRERETDGPFPERAPQGFVLARRPVVSGGCEDGDISTTD